MHLGNRDWLDDIQRRYGADLGRLLELGSLDVNGSAREHLRPSTWCGVDITPGPCVDICCDAAETLFSGVMFDTILSTSMLEHNATWRTALTHNLQWLRSGGLFLLSWGAEGNLHHLPEPWAPVPVGDVLEWAVLAGLHVLEACWERTRYTPDCDGCYDLIARKP